MATEPGQIRHLIDRAMRIALAERTVTCVIVPNDLQMEDAVADAAARARHRALGRRLRAAASHPRGRAAAARRRGAERGEKVAMLVGAGALHATHEVIEVADTLGAGVAKALLGKAAVPDDLPFVTGSIGLLGTRPSWELMQDCDTLLMVGSSFPYSEFLPEEGQARGVQIDLDGRMLGIRYPMEVNLVGDSALTLRALLPLLERKEDRSWREKIESNVAEWWQVIERRAHEPAEPINPQLIFHELSKRLPDGAILTSDSGSAANWYARDVRLRAGMMASLSGTLATMGPGVPYAIAAKFAYPTAGDRARRRRRDADERAGGADHDRQVPRALDRPAADRARAQQPRPQPGDLGAARDVRRPEVRRVSQELPDVPYARWAEMIGLNGIRIDDPDAIGECWDRALASDRPTVLEVVSDPEVPPLPPHITIEQARSFASAILHGDPARRRIIAQSLRQKLPEFLPGR